MNSVPHAFLCRWLEAQVGMDAAAIGARALQGAVRGRMRTLRLQDEAAYQALWRDGEDERQALLEELLVPETWFFRDGAAFALWREYLAAKAGQFSPQRPARVLCLPCATGEEAWSIAICLREAGLDAGNAQVHAFDVSRRSLAAARQGVYRQRSWRGQRLDEWSGHLQEGDPGYFHIAEPLRNMVDFRHGNALDRSLLLANAPYDAVFCRNLLIYLTPDARSGLYGGFADLLAPGGLLFLGHAESLPRALPGFRRHGRVDAFAWEYSGSAGVRPARRAESRREAESLRLPESRREAESLRLPESRREAETPRLPESRREAESPRLLESRREAESPRLSEFREKESEAGVFIGLRRAPSVAMDSGIPCRNDGFEAALNSTVLPVAAPIAEPLHEARAMADRGAYDAAQQLLQGQAAREPLNPDVHALLGVVCAARRQEDQAVGHWRRALYLDPGHSESLTHLALLLERQGNQAEANRLRRRLARQGAA